MSRHPERRRANRAGIALMCVSAGIVLALAGCSNPQTAVSPQPSSSGVSSPSASPSEPGTPALVPDGTAQDNLAVFATVTAAVWATAEQVSGRAYVDALVAAGFDKAAMQVTYDETTVGNPAESIQFSVRWGEECLVGQVGPATGTPVTVVVPVLGEGTCLIGDTRPIDW